MTGITHNQIAVDRRHIVALVLLAAAVAAIALVLVLAWTGEETAPTAAPIVDTPPVQTLGVVPGAARYDGGPEEGTRGLSSPTVPDSVRYDGGPEEGTRGLGH